MFDKRIFYQQFEVRKRLIYRMDIGLLNIYRISVVSFITYRLVTNLPFSSKDFQALFILHFTGIKLVRHSENNKILLQNLA
jgi:hypothetical protein